MKFKVMTELSAYQVIPMESALAQANSTTILISSQGGLRQQNLDFQVKFDLESWG